MTMLTLGIVIGLVCCLLISNFRKRSYAWHFRLGHPNFQYTKYLFPHLFNKVDISSFSCDVHSCKTAQGHLSVSPYKPSQPFALIHSDVWGPSSITISSGKQWSLTFIDDYICLTWPGQSQNGSLRPMGLTILRLFLLLQS